MSFKFRGKVLSEPAKRYYENKKKDVYSDIRQNLKTSLTDEDLDRYFDLDGKISRFLLDVENRSYFKNSTAFNAKTLKKEFIDEIFSAPIGNRTVYKELLATATKELKPKLDKIEEEAIKAKQLVGQSELDLKLAKDKFKLINKISEDENKIKSLRDEILDLSKDPSQESKEQQLIKERTIENLERIILSSLKKVELLDKELERSIKEQERNQNKLILEKKRKYKIMTKQSNQLAKEIQKTIERVAAQGFGDGEIQYTGRGRKSEAPKKPKKKVMKKTKRTKGGKMYFDDPSEEVAYILERLSEMVKDGDIQHLELVAKKLRKAKKIGKGKYYVFDDEIKEEEGSGYPVGGKMKKSKRTMKTKKGGKRPMSPKQKEWIKFVKEVHKANPELSYKEAMQKASSERSSM